MSPSLKKNLVIGYLASLYGLSLLFFTGIIPDWGQWYSANGYHRDQVNALLEGHFYLSQNPEDLAMDLAWAGGGVQQVWGLGVSLWRLPFDVLARAFGYAFFPDRLSLGILLMLTAFVVIRTWCNAGLGKIESYSLIFITVGASPLFNVLRSSMCQYEEVLVYVYCFGTMLGCGVLTLALRPSWKRFWFISAMAGMGGLIRPTLVFYGMATMMTTSLIMLTCKKTTQEQSTLRQTFYRLACGVLLFGIGGAILYLTNLARFGNGFEFGHNLNVSSALTSVYSTRFDYPFKHLPLTETASELFGALFLLNHFNGVGWYDQGIFMGQSNEIRWRGFDLNTYDLIYAALIGVAWLIVLGQAWKQLKTRSWQWGAIRDEHKNAPWILILWSLLASIPLFFFYLTSPAIASRYMLDFAPAFIAAITGLSGIIFNRIGHLRHALGLTGAISGLIVVWQIAEISAGKSGFGSPRSISLDDIRPKPAETQPLKKPLQEAYTTNTDMASWGIPFNGEGWGKDGTAWCCSIFYVESPEFLELELTTAPGRSLNEAPPEQIQAKVGLERLAPTSITSTNNTWLIRFAAPKRKQYLLGLHPVFIAWVPSKDLSKYVITPSPWILQKIRWRNSEDKPSIR